MATACETLEDRFNEIPEELEDLFSKMLHGLEGRYFSDAARLFRIYRASQEPGIGFQRGLPLLVLDLADDADFKSTALQRGEASQRGRNGIWRSTSMKRRLNSRCRGLVEIDHPRSNSGDILEHEGPRPARQ